MIFSITSLRNNKTVYAGVLEFVAQEEQCILPNWMFNNMSLQYDEMINVTLAPPLPKAQFLKLTPHETAFIDLPDPRSFLEIKFRNFVCLTQGDTIHIQKDYGKDEKVYCFDVTEVKPNSSNYFD